jgi:hypothetical protein
MNRLFYYSCILSLILTPYSRDLIADEIIYEPFEYSAGTIDDSSQSGGLGMSGNWTQTDSNGNPYSILSAGLTFTNLETSGNATARSSYSGYAKMSRQISPSSKLLLTADNTTVWFSVLINNTRRFSTGNEWQGVVLGSNEFDLGSGSPPNISGGEGIGLHHQNMDTIKGYVINGGTATSSATGLDISGLQTTYLIAGKIDFFQNGTNDTLRLFNITSPLDPEPSDGDAFATISGDLDQSIFNTLAIGSRQYASLDEIRFATSYYESLGRDLPITAYGTIIRID